MNVRSATAEDFEAITAVARATWHDTYDELEADVIDRTVDNWYTDDSMPLEASSTVVFVAERAGDLVGFTHAVAQGETATSSECTFTLITRVRGSGANSTSD